MPDDLDAYIAEANAMPAPTPAAPPANPASSPSRPASAAPPGHVPDDLDRLIAEADASAAARERGEPNGSVRSSAQHAPPAGPQTTTTQATALGIGDTTTFGFLDEAGGLADSLGATAGRDSIWNSDKSFGTILSDNIAKNRAILSASGDQHPYAYHGGQIGGAFLIPFGTGAKGALQVARTAAVQGAVYGAGSGEGVGGRLGEAAMGGVEGAALGTVLHPVLNAVGALGGKLKSLIVRTSKGDLPIEVAEGADAATIQAAGEKAAREAGITQEPVLGDGVVDAVAGKEATPAAPEPVPDTPAAWSLPDAQGNRQPVAHFEPVSPDPALDETVPLHTAGTPDAPEGEPAATQAGVAIGSISRAGLQDLQASVEKQRAGIATDGPRSADITPSSPEHPTLGAFRIGNLGDGPEPMSLLGALTRQLDGLPKLSDQELASQTLAAAKDMAGGDHEALGALAQEIAGPGGRPDLAIGVLRTVQRRAADAIDLFHGVGIDWSTASDDMVAQAGQDIFNLQKINELVQQSKVGAGRALRVFSLPNSEAYLQAMARGESIGLPPEVASDAFQAERSIPPLPSTREEMHDWMELWGMTKGDPAQQEAFLRGTLSVPTANNYLASSAANFFTANILSAPKTAILNVAGPTVINTVRFLEKAGGSAALALDPTISAAERAQYAATAKASALAPLQMFGDIRDAFRYGVQAFKTNRSVLGGGGTVADVAKSANPGMGSDLTFGPYNANLLRAAGADPDWRYSLGNVLNIWPRAFARVNAGLDEMAKRLTYMSETRTRAYVEAAGRGLAGDEAHAFVRNAMTSATDEAGQATSEALLRAAERSTLTGQVGADGSGARRFAQTVQNLRRDYPLTRFILPVFTVPANALGETMHRIPGLNLLPGFTEHAADLAGDNGVVSQAEAHGRTMLGASFLTAGYLMNQAGLLTGAGPLNPSDMRVWRLNHEPYSIRVGDTWVSYRKLDILGGLLSIPATISDASVYHKMDQGETDNLALAAVGSLATWFKDQASMRAATQVLSLGDTPLSDPGKLVESMGGQIAGGMVPGSGILRTVGVETTDPYVRMKRGWGDYVKSVIPGESQELEPLRNVLGEPVNRANNSVGEAVFPVSLAPVASWQKEPVLDELERLYRKTGYSASADPHAALFGMADPRDIKLEDGVSLYSHLTQPRASLEIDGQTMKQALQEAISSDDYAEAVDADSGQSVTSLGDRSRAYMISRVFDRYNRAIKAEVAASSPIALKYLTAATAKRRDDAYLHDVPLEDLVKNPDLYAAKGIDAQTYADTITEGAAGDLLQAVGGGSR